jgi:hypothetical protein
MKSTYKQIFEVVRLPAVMRLALLLMLCKVSALYQTQQPGPFFVLIAVDRLE